MNWQPIETAPRDGTEIDVWEYCHDPKWRPAEHGIEKGYRCTNIKWLDSRWVEFDITWGDWIALPNEHYSVSHWMPIPKPPVIA
jgi:hypothetical protein